MAKIEGPCFLDLPSFILHWDVSFIIFICLFGITALRLVDVGTQIQARAVLLLFLRDVGLRDLQVHLLVLLLGHRICGGQAMAYEVLEGCRRLPCGRVN